MSEHQEPPTLRREVCPTCEGDRSVWVEVEPCQRNPSGLELEDCPDCGGFGHILVPIEREAE